MDPNGKNELPVRGKKKVPHQPDSYGIFSFGAPNVPSSIPEKTAQVNPSHINGHALTSNNQPSFNQGSPIYLVFLQNIQLNSNPIHTNVKINAPPGGKSQITF